MKKVIGIIMAALGVVVILFVCKSVFKNNLLTTEFLIRELSETPERQQKALDELAKYDDARLSELLPFLEDEAILASKDVKFLNTNPKSFEKYYMTEAKRVDELLIRYVCWRTAKCDPIFPNLELGAVRRQAVEILTLKKN